MKRNLYATEKSTVVYLLVLCLLGLGYISVSSIGMIKELGDKNEVMWAYIIIGLLISIFLGVPSAVRMFFKSEENELFFRLPLTAFDSFLVKAIGNVFWNLIILFPIGCALVISYTISFSQSSYFLIIVIFLWFLLTVAISFSQSIIARLIYPTMRRYLLASHKKPTKTRIGSWFLIQRKFAFLHNKSVSIMIKDTIIDARQNKFNFISRSIITFIIGLFLALIVRNICSETDSKAILGVQIFFSIPILLFWSGTTFSLLEDEVRWLIRVLPLSSHELHFAKFIGRFIFLTVILFLFLLPSTVIAIIAKTNPMKVYVFTLMASFFLALWATSVLYLVFPNVNFGLKLYYVTTIVGLIFSVLFPPMLLVGILLAWRFSRIGIRKLANYPF